MTLSEASLSYIDNKTNQMDTSIGSEAWAADHDCDLPQNDSWQARTPKVHQRNRKAKRKNDTLIAVISQWIVEHQIGRFKPNPLLRCAIFTHRSRPCDQLTATIGHDACLLSPSPPTYSEVFPAVSLQPIFRQIHRGAG